MTFPANHLQPLSGNSTTEWDDEYWMAQAIQMAEAARDLGEVPVGAIIVKDDQLIAAAHNAPIQNHDPSAHAEINALRLAGQVLKNYRLVGCHMYVTLEPCCMCAGAMIQARLERVVFAASDPKAGAAGSIFNLLQNSHLNHRIEVKQGILQPQASELLSTFFMNRRKVKHGNHNS